LFDEIPKTSTVKIQKYILRRRFCDGQDGLQPAALWIRRNTKPDRLKPVLLARKLKRARAIVI